MISYKAKHATYSYDHEESSTGKESKLTKKKNN